MSKNMRNERNTLRGCENQYDAHEYKLFWMEKYKLKKFGLTSTPISMEYYAENNEAKNASHVASDIDESACII